MRETIGGKVYDTEKATLVASDRYWDGSNWDRRGRNQYLYKTAKGNYFLFNTTMWQGEQDNIEPIDKDTAKRFWDQLRKKEVSWEEAFDEAPEEA